MCLALSSTLSEGEYICNNLTNPGLPDGKFEHQKSQLGYTLYVEPWIGKYGYFCHLL
jgi:hypothetical protein